MEVEGWYGGMQMVRVQVVSSRTYLEEDLETTSSCKSSSIIARYCGITEGEAHNRSLHKHSWQSHTKTCFWRPWLHHSAPSHSSPLLLSP